MSKPVDVATEVIDQAAADKAVADKAAADQAAMDKAAAESSPDAIGHNAWLESRDIDE